MPFVQLKTDLTIFNDRYQHAYNKIQFHIPESLRSGRFLDIGCGMGNAVVAALKHGANLALGVDRSLEEFGHHFSASEFPLICQHYNVDPRKSLLLQANIFDLGFYDNGFDYIFMLDSIEHVPDPKRFIDFAFQAVKPGGVFLLDTCPLYYSKGGHHLWGYFPVDTLPWAHLRYDFNHQLSSVDQWSLERFHELNKTTHSQVRNYIIEAGFEIQEEVRREADPESRRKLEECRPYLNLNGIDERCLFEDWILIVGKKPT